MLNNKHFEYIGRISCLWSGIEQGAQIYLSAMRNGEFESTIQDVVKLTPEDLVEELENRLVSLLPQRKNDFSEWRNEFLDLKNRRHEIVHSGWEMAYEDLVQMVGKSKIESLLNEQARSQFFIRRTKRNFGEGNPVRNILWTYSDMELLEARMRKLARDFFKVFI